MEIKKWYTKKRYILPILAFSGLVAFSGDSSSTQQNNVIVPPVQTRQLVSPAPTVTEKKVTPETKPTIESVPSSKKVETTKKVENSYSGLSNDNYYENVDGNRVHSPAYSDSVPAGASAQCRDGTYSFSQNRRGTCSGHGGVATWF